ncbi:3-oxoacyl-ACP reductase [Spelaeicoccus albus]|uniref:3-oxoacyl-[acyl-carrier protein] reductase n=1 Tax=Spelaeicoccus albus TaxID=1280376 RepID=A0A7Z0IIG9_9MICO|nr:3-oxoacyl-ACP reductase [Spelaeicoccus albus]NYI68465.1 3-oxoacyl-[acyl-carrier protein] reductase [Spelaeicoccus albus]
MSDKYIDLISSGAGKNIAKRLGLPQPARLRRYLPGAPVIDGPVLVTGPASDAGDAVRTTLLDWRLDVRRHAAPGEKLGAIVVDFTSVAHPADLTETSITVGGALRDLKSGGRIVVLTRPSCAGDDAPVAAARQGVDGWLRSLAHEMRGGSTANGIAISGDVPASAPSVSGALRFLLSGRSAFVDGQFIHVTSNAGSLPEDWELPLAGRVAVVTGAARGIGAEVARVLARDGASLVVVDVPAAGEALSKVANTVGGTALQLDITSEDAGQRIIDHAVARHGGIDIVVHNAGITRDRLLANMAEDRFASVVAVNVAAPLTINEALLASDKFTNAPRIVGLASTSGIAGNRGQTNYATSKAGVIGMVRATAPRMESVGGTANAVAPGFIDTEMTARMPFATREVARRLNSLQQAGLPVDVAETIAFLSSPQAGGVRGDVIRVCGQNLVGA